MKKTLLLILVLSVLSISLTAQTNDIRKLRWGMTYDEVIKTEGLKNSLFKEEELLGSRVDVVFGCSKEGLHSVTYSTKEVAFAGKVMTILDAKYGDAAKDHDFYFLTEIQKILEKYPKAVVDILTDKDYTELNKIGMTPSKVKDKYIIKGGLKLRKKWAFGNTVVLLLDNGIEGAILSYRSQKIHEKSKLAFQKNLVELKKLVKEIEAKKAAATNENL